MSTSPSAEGPLPFAPEVADALAEGRAKRRPTAPIAPRILVDPAGRRPMVDEPVANLGSCAVRIRTVAVPGARPASAGDGP